MALQTLKRKNSSKALLNILKDKLKGKRLQEVKARAVIESLNCSSEACQVTTSTCTLPAPPLQPVLGLDLVTAAAKHVESALFYNRHRRSFTRFFDKALNN